MSWFYERPRPVETAHNGTMKLSRFWGKWRLQGFDGTEQAAPYMDALWRKALRRAARAGGWRWSPRRVLVLGVAMGGTFRLVRERWPNAELVGVDWEPALYALGQQIGIWRPDGRTRYVEGEAGATVGTLAGRFDLVLVDLYRGDAAADAMLASPLPTAVAERLTPGGVVALNAFRQPEMVPVWSAALGSPKLFRYEGNRLALFRTDPRRP